jgi:hypothetical protein
MCTLETEMINTSTEADLILHIQNSAQGYYGYLLAYLNSLGAAAKGAAAAGSANRGPDASPDLREETHGDIALPGRFHCIETPDADLFQIEIVEISAVQSTVRLRRCPLGKTVQATDIAGASTDHRCDAADPAEMRSANGSGSRCAHTGEHPPEDPYCEIQIIPMTEEVQEG